MANEPYTNNSGVRTLNLFISWSGPVSNAVAQALFTWLPQTLSFIEPWFSSEKVAGGEKWTPQLESALRTCDVAIICLTSENLESKWLHFEAGAIAVRAEKPLLIPYLLDLSTDKVPFPLANYQAREANLTGTTRLIRDIVQYAAFLKIPQAAGSGKSITAEYAELEKSLQDIRSRFGTPLDAAFRLAAGVSFDYRKLIDDKTNEVIITGQNIQGLLRNGALPFLKERFQNNPLFRIVFILTVAEYFKVIASTHKEKQNFMLQFGNTIRSLTEFKSSLPVERQADLQVYFHPGVSSLSAMFRDPTSKDRGMVAFFPKWSTDVEPDSRIFCLVYRSSNDYLFNRIYGHIGIMRDPVHSKTLEDMAKWLEKS